MALIASDGFGRPDSATIGTTEVGGLTWVEDGDVFSISGGRLVASTSGSGMVTVDPSTTDVDVAVQMTTPASGFAGGLIVRGTDIGNRLSIVYNPADGAARLFKTVGGSTSPFLAQTDPFSPPVGTPWELRAVTEGPDIEVYALGSGTPVLGHTLTGGDEVTFATARRVGIRSSTGSAAASWDLFTVSSLASGTPGAGRGLMPILMAV